MACGRGHALATRRARDGSSCWCGPVFPIKHGNRSSNHQNSSCEYLFNAAAKDFDLACHSGPPTGSSSSASITRRADRGRPRIRAACTSSTARVLWRWTTSGDGYSPTGSDGAAFGNASTDIAIRRHDGYAPVRLSFVFVFDTNCIAPAWRYTVMHGRP